MNEFLFQSDSEVTLRHKETKVTTATCMNYVIISVLHNVHRGAHTKLCHQSQYRRILENPNQPSRNDTPAPTDEGRESRVTRKVGITQQRQRS